MNKWKYLIVLAVSVILQSTVLSGVEIFGAGGNLLLVVTIVLSFMRGERWGGYTGLFLGLLEDIMFARVLGIRALLYFLSGTFIGRFAYRSGTYRTTGVFAAFLLTCFISIGSLLFHTLLGLGEIPVYYLKGPMFVEAVINGLLFVVVHFVLQHFLKADHVQKYKTYL